MTEPEPYVSPEPFEVFLRAILSGGNTATAAKLAGPEGLFRFLVDWLIAHRTREHWEVWRGDRPPGPGSPLTRVQQELNGILLMVAERSHDVGALAAHVHVFTEAERCEVCGFDRSA